jgi:hypothetical protein
MRLAHSLAPHSLALAHPLGAVSCEFLTLSYYLFITKHTFFSTIEHCSSIHIGSSDWVPTLI